MIDIEKLRALCAEVPESLTVDCRGDVVVGVDGIPAERTGVHPVGSLFPLVLRSPRADCDSLAVARLAAAARPAILALCDRVERAEAEVERLRSAVAAANCPECKGAGAFVFGGARLGCVHCRPARERADRSRGGA